MARKLLEKAQVLELLKEVLAENYGKDVRKIRGTLDYYFAGYGEMDDDFTPREKVIANMMTKKQWQQALDSINDEELASCIPVETEEAVEVETEEAVEVETEEAVEVETEEAVEVETEEAVEVETEENKEVKKACNLLQGYLDDQGSGLDVVPECKSWDEFEQVCSKFFSIPAYFIENYIKVNL